MNVYLFPGQGSQFPGMGQDLYEQNARAHELFESANQLLGFSITAAMFTGTADELQETHIAQPAIFLHSVILAAISPQFQPEMVAGHSLGELSALVASRVLTFEDGLRLVSVRAKAMQAACELNPGTMAAVLGLADEVVEEVCRNIDAVVAPANYNCPGQLVISGTLVGVEQACQALQAAGAKKVVSLQVGGGFHTALMASAQTAFAHAVEQTPFRKPICPIYQNVNAAPTKDPGLIQVQLIKQLTAPILWTQTIQHMSEDGATCFIACGPGKVLQGLVKKIQPDALIETL
jgi:[acyl-carrier-protein] S-malonyltransferase